MVMTAEMRMNIDSYGSIHVRPWVLGLLQHQSHYGQYLVETMMWRVHDAVIIPLRGGIDVPEANLLVLPVDTDSKHNFEKTSNFTLRYYSMSIANLVKSARVHVQKIAKENLLWE